MSTRLLRKPGIASMMICWMICSNAIDASVDGGDLLTLVQDGRSEATIVIADQPLVMGPSDQPQLIVREADSRHTQRVAAEKLQTYISKASGATIPIVLASEAPAEGTLILVGRSELTERYDIQPPSETEGVRIKTFPRGVALVGEVAPVGTNNLDFEHDRGTMHAVTIFLEKYLDFGFYFDKEVDGDEDFGVVIPQSTTMTAPASIDHQDAPAYSHRFTYGFFGSEIKMGNPRLMPIGHTDDGWRLRYRESNPEYFRLRPDGTRDFRFLCYSEPGVIDQRMADYAAWYEEGKAPLGHNPSAHYISVSPADNLADCHCERCKELSKSEFNPVQRFSHQPQGWGRQSNVYFKHIKDLALRVKEQWPERRVVTLAYQGYTLPPEFDLPENVDIVLAVLAPSHIYKEPESRPINDELIKSWSAKLGGDRDRLLIWDYPVWPGLWTAAPIIYPHVKQQWLHDYSEYVSGEYLNSRGRSPQEAHWFINVWFRMLWNPDLNVDEHLTDYCKRFFGPAAEPMEKFYRLAIDRYQNVRWSENAIDYSAGLFKGLYGETYTPEVLDQLESYFHEAMVAVNASRGSTLREIKPEDGWVHTNTLATDTQYGIEIKAKGSPVNNPTIRWGDGEIRYRGELYNGLRLVVEPGIDGPRARLYPVNLISSEMSADNPQGGNTGYRQASKWLRNYASPGADYRVTLTGRTADDGNPMVVLYYGLTGDGRHGNQFFSGRRVFPSDGQWATVTDVFTVPDDVEGFNRIDFFRRDGEVWFADVSMHPDLPEDGLDVTDRIEGSLPMLKAGETASFQFTGDASNDDASVRIALDVPERNAVQDDIYKRRVYWMREWLENFSPDPLQRRGRMGFFVEARQAHRWVDRNRVYHAVRVDQSPEADFQASQWREAASTHLVQGKDDLRAGRDPYDRLGFTADFPTRVQIVHDNEHVYLAFRCSQTHAPTSEDAVAMAFYNNDKLLFEATIHADNSLASDTSTIRSETVAGQGWWGAFVTVPAELLSTNGRLDRVRASFTRTRTQAPDEAGRATGQDVVELPLPVGAESPSTSDDIISYTWSPLVEGNLGWRGYPWHRRGTVIFE
ncbi:DUF4838 domain-containing protein [Phycisphaerales bacterium AB-hyl4]|uniref:DUF4838 domain-containing protein n=1 Tax=Natronomicrosphaera hydrolytica TaxID=3242702 RepID=A0ABV4U5E8_9BACT